MSKQVQPELLSREERIQNELFLAKRNAMQAIGHGVGTLEALSEQDEELKGAEDTLEATENLVAKSMTTLRGMTWGGFLYNKCVDTKEIVFGQAAPTKETINERTSGVSSSSTSNERSTVSAGESGSSLATSRDKDDLQEISAAVATLHQMSLEIGTQLELQNHTIEGLSAKSEKVTEQTLVVTIKASQLRDRSRGSRPQYGGMYQFIDTVTNQFLSVKDGRLVLSPVLNRASYFHCFVKETNLFAAQNDKYQKYMGCAFLGHIVVESTYFGTQEEVFIDFKSEKSGILFLPRHWGAGGWLKRPPAVAVQKEGEPPVPPSLPYMTETTSSIEDKEGFIEFRPVKINAKQKLAEEEL